MTKEHSTPQARHKGGMKKRVGPWVGVWEILQSFHLGAQGHAQGHEQVRCLEGVVSQVVCVGEVGERLAPRHQPKWGAHARPPRTFSFLECSTSKLTSLYFISTSETRRTTLQRRLRICEAGDERVSDHGSRAKSSWRAIPRQGRIARRRGT